HKIFFLIMPEPGFVERIERSGSELLLDLARPTLWSGDESDRSVLQRSDMDTLVKLLFADLVIRERSGDVAFKDLFKNVTLTTDFFDAHWVLSRIPLDMTIEDALEDSLRSESVSSMLPSGSSRLDDVLLEYQAKGKGKGVGGNFPTHPQH